MTNPHEILLHHAPPDEMPSAWVGQENIKKRLCAALLRLESGDPPLNPCLVGKPGMGKTSLAYHVGRELFAQDVYIFQCTQDTRPEDLIVSPVLGPEGSILSSSLGLMPRRLRR